MTQELDRACAYNDSHRDDDLIDIEAEAKHRLLLDSEITRLDGMFAGACRPEEYQYLLDLGFMHYSYEGAAGFMGLSKLRRTTA